jgi:hypothetical protein
MSMPPASSPSRTRRRALFCALALWGLSSPLCFAQEQNPVLAPTQGMDYTLQSQDASASASYWDEPRVAGGYGFKGRIGNEAGSTVGRNQSITYFDLSPYIFQDNLYLFGEGRLGIVPSGQVGGSAGGGFRYYFPQINSIVGFNSFWDGDNTRGVMFNQWGLGGEVLTEWLDIRANYYFPYGNTFQVTGQRFEAGSQQFVDVSSVTGNAATPGHTCSFSGGPLRRTPCRASTSCSPSPFRGIWLSESTWKHRRASTISPRLRPTCRKSGVGSCAGTPTSLNASRTCSWKS